MFTGLIQDVGCVCALSLDRQAGGWMVIQAASQLYQRLGIGQSVACSGVCLTVIESWQEENQTFFKVQFSKETIDRTWFSDLRIGRHINLELSLRVGDSLDGHWVGGHVDGIVKLCNKQQQGDYQIMDFTLPQAFQPFLVHKGSVALDGVSLTVNVVTADYFSVCLIPHTLTHTSLQDVQLGQAVNIELDMMARYAHRWSSLYQGQDVHA